MKMKEEEYIKEHGEKGRSALIMGHSIANKMKSPISKVLKKETGEKPLPKRRMTEDEGVNLPRSHSFWKTYSGGKASFMKENREIKKRNK